MRLSDLAPDAMRAQLARDGLRIRMGPYVTRVRSAFGDLAQAIRDGYAHHEVDADAFSDFDVSIVRPRGIRRWLRPQALFLLDHVTPFHRHVSESGPPLPEPPNSTVSARTPSNTIA